MSPRVPNTHCCLCKQPVSAGLSTPIHEVQLDCSHYMHRTCYSSWSDAIQITTTNENIDLNQCLDCYKAQLLQSNNANAKEDSLLGGGLSTVTDVAVANLLDQQWNEGETAELEDYVILDPNQDPADHAAQSSEYAAIKALSLKDDDEISKMEAHIAAGGVADNAKSSGIIVDHVSQFEEANSLPPEQSPMGLPLESSPHETRHLPNGAATRSEQPVMSRVESQPQLPPPPTTEMAKVPLQPIITITPCYPTIPSKVRPDRPCTLSSLITLKAPSVPATSEPVPLDLVCVVDVSASMSGSKLASVLKTLLYIASHLTSSDRLSIVTFSATAEVVYPLAAPGVPSWNEMVNVIEGIKSRQGTSIRDGLELGLAVLLSGKTSASRLDGAGKKNNSGRVSAVLLLSDGQDNKLKHSSPEYDRLVDSAESQDVSIYTFGYGKEHDDLTLSKLAGSLGTFNYIENTGQVQHAFAGCLGALKSTVFRDIQLKLELPKSTSTLGVPLVLRRIAGSFKTYLNPARTMTTVSIGNLFAEEERSFIAEIKLTDNPPKNVIDGGMALLLLVNCSYTDVTTETRVPVLATGPVSLFQGFHPGSSVGPDRVLPDSAVISQMIENVVAAALKEAMLMATKLSTRSKSSLPNNRDNLDKAFDVLVSKRRDITRLMAQALDLNHEELRNLMPPAPARPQQLQQQKNPRLSTIQQQEERSNKRSSLPPNMFGAISREQHSFVLMPFISSTNRGGDSDNDQWGPSSSPYESDLQYGLRLVPESKDPGAMRPYTAYYFAPPMTVVANKSLKTLWKQFLNVLEEYDGSARKYMNSVSAESFQKSGEQALQNVLVNVHTTQRSVYVPPSPPRAVANATDKKGVAANDDSDDYDEIFITAASRMQTRQAREFQTNSEKK